METEQTKIEPALDAKEWARAQKPIWYRVDDLRGLVSKLAEWDRQAVAALCLHGQSFGFTWEDVDALRACGKQWFPRTGRAAFDDLADRIAALLPPRE